MKKGLRFLTTLKDTEGAEGDILLAFTILCEFISISTTYISLIFNFPKFGLIKCSRENPKLCFSFLFGL